MTERKPADMSFPSWVDKQIHDAAERGEFDDLPGAGKPIPKSDEADEGQAWLRNYLRREGVPAEEMLPTPLRLRKEAERLAQTVHALTSEQHVREAVAELNERIMKWRRIPLGPPIFVALVDEQAMVARWAEARAEVPPDGPVTAEPPVAPIPARRWWRRRGSAPPG
jgi:DnaJ-like protein